jgi:hypothetical protein
LTDRGSWPARLFEACQATLIQPAVHAVSSERVGRGPSGDVCGRRAVQQHLHISGRADVIRALALFNEALQESIRRNPRPRKSRPPTCDLGDAHFLIYEKTNSKSVLCSADDDNAAYDGVLGDRNAPGCNDSPGTCTAAEYQRMAAEKVAAMQISIAALMRGRGQAATLAPFVNRARANARRLHHKS